FTSRLKGIDRDGERFSADVSEVVARVAPDLAGEPPDAAAEALFTRLRHARDADRAGRSVAERIAEEEEALDAAGRAGAEARRTPGRGPARASPPSAARRAPPMSPAPPGRSGSRTGGRGWGQTCGGARSSSARSAAAPPSGRSPRGPHASTPTRSTT